jgi:hypothetical protein
MTIINVIEATQVSPAGTPRADDKVAPVRVEPGVGSTVSGNDAYLPKSVKSVGFNTTAGGSPIAGLNVTDRGLLQIAGARTPEVYVFDTFGQGGIDLNGDGMGDVSHGDIPALIIRAETGIEPQRVPTGQWDNESQAIAVLDGLLARDNVSNVFLSFSIDAGSNPAVRERVMALAERGAQIFIAAGNEDINALSVGMRHKNIHIVAASEAVIGQTESNTPTGDFVRNPATTTVANGIVDPQVTAEGIDINGDQTADVLNSQLAQVDGDVNGRRLADVDATAGIRALPPQTDISTIPDELGGVVSIGVLRERGMIPAEVVQVLQRSTGLSVSELDRSYILLAPYWTYATSFGESGGMVVYRVDGDGMLNRVQQRSSITGQEATSWATPNELSQRVNDYIRSQIRP